MCNYWIRPAILTWWHFSGIASLLGYFARGHSHLEQPRRIKCILNKVLLSYFLEEAQHVRRGKWEENSPEREAPRNSTRDHLTRFIWRREGGRLFCCGLNWSRARLLLISGESLVLGHRHQGGAAPLSNRLDPPLLSGANPGRPSSRRDIAPNLWPRVTSVSSDPWVVAIFKLSISDQRRDWGLSLL